MTGAEGEVCAARRALVRPLPMATVRGTAGGECEARLSAVGETASSFGGEPCSYNKHNVSHTAGDMVSQATPFNLLRFNGWACETTANTVLCPTCGSEGD